MYAAVLHQHELENAALEKVLSTHVKYGYFGWQKDLQLAISGCLSTRPSLTSIYSAG